MPVRIPTKRRTIGLILSEGSQMIADRTLFSRRKSQSDWLDAANVNILGPIRVKVSSLKSFVRAIPWPSARRQPR